MSVNPKNSVSAVIPKITATAFDAIARHVFPDVSGAVGHRNSGVTKLKFSGCCAIHARIARAAYSANDSSRTSSSYAPSSRASASRVTVRVTVRVRSQPAASNAVTAPRAARARRRAVAAPLDARATLEVARARIVAPHRVDVVAIRRDVRYLRMSRGVARARAAPAPVARFRARHRAGRAVPRAASLGVDLEPWARPLERALDFRRDGAGSASSRAASLFTTAVFARAYWRGYRQLFRALGYPGAAAEASLALGTLRDGGAMLDVSCGPGLILDLLARHSARSGKWERVVGLDYSREMVTLAREACGERATVVVADACDLPFADGAFDVLHSSAGAHCWGDLNSRGVPESAFREMYRVLKPTGEILVSTVVLLKPTTVEEEYSRTPNTPFFDERAVCRMIQDAGFRDVEVIAKDKCFVAVKAVK